MGGEHSGGFLLWALFSSGLTESRRRRRSHRAEEGDLGRARLGILIVPCLMHALLYCTLLDPRNLDSRGTSF